MSVSAARVTFRFGEFEVDAVAYELRHKGRRIRLARQPMDLLLLLLERPRELVLRDDIAKRLWSSDVFVDLDAGIRTAILRIRQVLGDSHESRGSWRPCQEGAIGSSHRLELVPATNPQRSPASMRASENLPERPRT